jgi:hypothetical protein
MIVRTHATHSRSDGRHWLARVCAITALAAGGGGFSVAEAERVERLAPALASAPVRASRNCGSAVVLVALDGVRWQEVFQGVDARLALQHELRPAERVSARELMPNLHRLLAQGGAALGADAGLGAMRASGPNFVSLPGYIELLTGRTRSGCTDNECGHVRSATLLDELAANGCGDSAVFSSWPGIGFATSMLGTSGKSSVGRTSGHDRALLAQVPAVGQILHEGEQTNAEPGDGDFRHDELTARAALAYLHAVHPQLLFVGLGETDEYGHAGDYRGYLNALRQADAFLGDVIAEVDSEIGRGHPTTLLVTTDHGRADTFRDHGARHPESARVWLVAAGSGIAARGLVPSAQPRYLADIAPTIRQLLGVPVSTLPDSGSPLHELLTATELHPI